MKRVFIMSLNTSPLGKVHVGPPQRLRHDSGSLVLNAMKLKDPRMYPVIFTDIKICQVLRNNNCWNHVEHSKLLIISHLNFYYLTLLSHLCANNIVTFKHPKKLNFISTTFKTWIFCVSPYLLMFDCSWQIMTTHLIHLASIKSFV